jgi:hypothetical protein
MLPASIRVVPSPPASPAMPAPTRTWRGASPVPGPSPGAEPLSPAELISKMYTEYERLRSRGERREERGERREERLGSRQRSRHLTRRV